MATNDSHIDIRKLHSVPSGHPFEYKDVVEDNLPTHEHTIGGKYFKEEVEKGTYEGVILEKDTGSHLLYKKL